MKLKMFIALVCTTTYSCAESFTQPKKKVPSCNASKEACAQVGGEILKKIPDALDGIAAVQRSIIAMENQLLEGDKKGFMAKANKEQLHEYRQILEQFHQEQERFNRATISAHNRLKQLEEKIIAE